MRGYENEGTESESIESEGIDIDGIGGKDIDGEGKDDYRCVASPQYKGKRDGLSFYP